jgi:hypothetical protein
VAAAGKGANAGKELDVSAVYEAEPPWGVELNELLDIFRVDPTVIATRLPSVARVSETPPSESRLELWEKDRCRPCDPSGHG